MSNDEHETQESAPTAAPQFDEYYYSHDCGLPYARDEHWRGFFAGVADGIIREFAPATVLDVGCAMGLLVEALRDRGVEAWGIDISDYAIGEVHESVAQYCAVSSATTDLPDHFPRLFDLVTCVEVIEHLPVDGADAAIEHLGRWGRRVLFSSSPHDFAEATHLNVQPPEEWAALFARHGLVRDFDVDCTFLTPWAVGFDHSLSTLPYVVKRYERTFSRFQRENIDLRAGIVRMQGALANSDRARETSEDELSNMRASDASDRAVVEEELARSKASLAEANERADTHLANAEVAHSELAAHIERTSELARHYDAAIADRETLNATVDRLLAELDETRARLSELRRLYDELAGQRTRVDDRISRELDESRAAMDTLERDRNDLRAQLDAIHRSRTWRYGSALSAPLRWGRRT